MEKRYWTELLTDALPGRVAKPRISGLTMIIDTGIPITMMRDLLQLASDHVDFWKFGFASASVSPPERIMDKVTLCQEYGVLAYPGGTSLEIAVTQGVWKDFLKTLWEQGVRAVEVSDGTIDLPLRTRREMIRTANKMGFTVLSEVGKKLPGSFLPVAEQAQMIHGDLNSGANYIIVEGREAGREVGVYDRDGNVRDNDVQALLDILGPLSTRLIWEAPLAKQQTYYIKKLGNKVNLGNIKPLDLITVESLRRGFRSDTLRVGLGMAEPPSQQGSESSPGQGQTQSPGDSHNPTGPSHDAASSAGRPTLWTESSTLNGPGHTASSKVRKDKPH
ncbi:phosphosulfolactate synthase [Alicyclobacillus tolerans]|uniref:phosphosulfolactate synthase n=1 Tax=Alicyclobacillus tolerans TaxID=90970 RepID=UPI001F1DB723|nr:phosphosulfolactate synthase [Alicyclobacillus tolerans]MCF8564961.1 phosphosulfolactate synthase [Alicyclobacillus tolerans]